MAGLLDQAFRQGQISEIPVLTPELASQLGIQDPSLIGLPVTEVAAQLSGNTEQQSTASALLSPLAGQLEGQQVASPTNPFISGGATTFQNISSPQDVATQQFEGQEAIRTGLSSEFEASVPDPNNPGLRILEREDGTFVYFAECYYYSPSKNFDY